VDQPIVAAVARLRIWAIAVASLGLLLAAPGAGAEDLDQIIPGLYGGDGIFLASIGHNAHFAEDSLQAFDSLSSGISSGVNLANLGSSTASFTFDSQQAVFVRSTESLGPTYAERAETIGKGKLNIAWTYTRLDYKKYRGSNLDNLHLVFPHEDLCSNGVGETNCSTPQPSPGVPSFEKDSILVDLDVNLNQDQYLIYGKYGITSNWDVGLIVPLIHSKLRVSSLATIQRNAPEFISKNAHNFCLPGQTTCAAEADISTLNSTEQTADSGSGQYTGIGDIVLRTKYNFFRDQPVAPDLAVLGGVRFASGDDNNYAGAGNTGFQGYLVASKKLGMFVPHLNWGTEITTDGGDTDIWRLIAGSEFSPIPQLTLSADVVGQQSWNGEGVSARIWDVGLGAKVNPWRTLTLIASFLVPINKNNGLRTDFTWTAGLEYTF
jgi:hypothetical protein